MTPAATAPRSRIYRGRVTHRRIGPADNRFRYGLFMLYLDLDELPGLFDRFWLWSARRPALARYHRADYLGDPSRPLADCVRERIQAELGWAPTGPIRLLTHVRYLGYCFNPVSFYYCFDEHGQLQVIVAEITNTPWDERHSYVLQATPGAGVHRFAFAKQFHVSPFMPMGQQYHWHFSEPGERLAVYMENRQEGRRLFDAALELQAEPVDGRSLARALLRFPAMTAVVAWRIYWQALRLLLKKAPFHPHPAGTREGRRQ